MYRLEDLDEPIKIMAATIENLQNRKEYFSAGLIEITKQVSKIQEVMAYLQKNFSGEVEELVKIINRSKLIDKLSLELNEFLDAKETEFMNIEAHTSDLTLPS